MIQKFFLICILLCSQLSFANEKTLIRLGVLAFGTLNWEVKAMQQANMMETEHYRLHLIKMANPQAGKIALQSGAVDMIVADWIWVSRMRTLGKDYTFYPYSNTTGALIVAENSPIQKLKDLKDKKLAIAGGELDKNSLLLQALMQKQGQAEIFASIQKIYGAPPLLSQQMQRQRVDALLTYWHYAVRMQAEGYRVLMTGHDIVQGLGINTRVPSIGYVFGLSWANNNKLAVRAFLANTLQIKDSLCLDAIAWQKLKILMRTKTYRENQLLRQQYCNGRVTNWGHQERQAAANIYQYLRKMINKHLISEKKNISLGTFYNYLD